MQETVNKNYTQEYGNLEDKKYIAVLDLELTCWPDGEKPRSEMEITEIGVAVINKKLEVVTEISEFVRPLKNPTLSEYCKTLTGITQENVDTAKPLTEAILDVVAILPPFNEFIWCAWGRDPVWLQKELDLKVAKVGDKSVIQFDTRFINLKVIDGKKRGLKKALSARNIEQVMPAHRALSDALSTAKLAKHMRIEAVDALVSNKKTYRQTQLRLERDAVAKLVKRTGISEKAAALCLKVTNGDFNRCKELIKVMRDEYK